MDKNEHTVGSKHIKMKQQGPMGRGPTEGMGTGKKANDFRKNLRQLLSYIKTYAPMIILSMVLALAGSVFNVIGPDKLSDIAISPLFNFKF